jgi:hypothetical protein
MVRVSNWIWWVLLLSACGRAESERGCDSDFDCKGERICVLGACQDPDSPDPVLEPTIRGGNGSGAAASGGRTTAATGGRSVTPTTGGTVSVGGSSGAGLSGGRSSSGGASSTPDDSQLLELDAQAIIADPARGLVYASLKGDSAEFPNSIVVIDAESASVVDSVSVGSDPTCLALSDDGSTLWVGLKGAIAVRSVDVSTSPPVAGELHNLPPAQFGDLAAAGSIVVLPGTTDSIVVSMHRDDLSPSFSGLVVLDAGVPRTNGTAGHTGASRMTGGPPGYVFGFNDQHTGFGFYSVRVEPEGLVQTEHGELLSGFDNDIVYDSSFVFATGGEVVDVSDPDAPKRAGSFAFRGLVAPSGAPGYALMLSTSGSTQQNPTLRLLEVETFTQADSEVLPFSLPIAQAFVRTGSDRFAVLESSTVPAPFEPPGLHALRFFEVPGFTP